MKKLTHHHTVTGIECIFLEAEKIQFHYVHLKKKKEQIEIQETGSVDSIDELKNQINPATPIYISITGRGILSKNIKHAGVTENNKVFQRLFPNARIEDFNIQRFPYTDGIGLCVSRTQRIDQLLLAFKNQNLFVIGLALGNLDIQYIAPYLNTTTDIQTNTQLLTLNTEYLFTIIESKKLESDISYKIGDDHLSALYLTAYATAFQGLVRQQTGVANPLISKNQSEFKHAQLFKIGGLSLLGSLLFILLLNTLLYYNYKGKSDQLSTALQIKQSQLDELEQVKNKLGNQQRLIQQTNIQLNSRTSFFADQIGVTIPKGIQLSKLIVFPLKGKEDDYRSTDLKSFQQEKISIKGLCKSSLNYNNWMKELRSLDWVKDVEHVNYVDLDKNIGEFEFDIILSFLE